MASPELQAVIELLRAQPTIDADFPARRVSIEEATSVWPIPEGTQFEAVDAGGVPCEWVWKMAQWPIVFVLVSAAIGVVYYLAPAEPQTLRSVVPGAVLATSLWLAASLGFRYYVENFSSYNETYGTIGGIIILMLWFYLSGLAIIVGAELNSEIKHTRREASESAV
jgi:uncharacterized BrkB/YihY/UPF0761 family membrane protein